MSDEDQGTRSKLAGRAEDDHAAYAETAEALKNLRARVRELEYEELAANGGEAEGAEIERLRAAQAGMEAAMLEELDSRIAEITARTDRLMARYA